MANSRVIEYNSGGRLVGDDHQPTKPTQGFRDELARAIEYYPLSSPCANGKGVFVSTTAYIYGLKEQGTEEIRYIGHTSKLRDRLWCHKRADGKHYTEGNRPLGQWLQTVGDKVEMVVIEETTTDLARQREELQIRDYRQKKHRLLNKRGAALYALTADEKRAMLTRAIIER